MCSIYRWKTNETEEVCNYKLNQFSPTDVGNERDDDRPKQDQTGVAREKKKEGLIIRPTRSLAC